MNSNGAVATNVAIQHPNIFYFVLSASWSNMNSLEFWNKGNAVTTNNNNTVYKTIYSPSPGDYIEPRTASFTGFTLSGGNSTSGFNISGSFNNGFNFYNQPNFTGSTVFFSALGFRDVYSGRVNTSTGGGVAGVNNDGNYWTAGPSSTIVYARYFRFHSGSVFTQNEEARSHGFTSRPVLE